MANFTKDGYKNTYVKNLFVCENEFRTNQKKFSNVPSYKESKNVLPIPFWKDHENYISMYNRTWELAFDHIYKPNENSGFCSSYIDTAYNGNIFMWDSCFITLFARYGSNSFSFQNTLDNFYSKQHPDGFICREITAEGEDEFHRYDPVSTGPNIFSLSELEYYHNYGDKKRLYNIFAPLCAYHQWLMNNRRWKDGSYWTSGWGSGMDNIPRVNKKYHLSYSHGFMSWLDPTLQQYIDASILLDFGFELERWQEIVDFDTEKKNLKKYILENMWDEERGFLFDVDENGNKIDTMHIGAFWVLHTDILNKKQLDKVVSKLRKGGAFYLDRMVPSLSIDNSEFKEDGRYWQGGVWAPMNYVIISGLYKNGYHKEAFEIADKIIRQVEKVYEKTNTFYEYYSPSEDAPGFFAREDFIGWTGLVPIAILFEYIFGIHPYRNKNKIIWDINLDKPFGVDKYLFGDKVIKLKCLNISDEKVEIEILSECDFELQVRFKNKEKTINISSGKKHSYII